VLVKTYSKTHINPTLIEGNIAKDMQNNPIHTVVNQGLSRFQWRVILLCFLIALCDGFDTQAVAFTGPAMIEAFQLKAGALAPVLTAGIIGMTAGAMMLGMLADKLVVVIP